MPRQEAIGPARVSPVARRVGLRQRGHRVPALRTRGPSMDDLTPTDGPDQRRGTDGAGIGDADLVARVRDGAGDDEPYAELYRRHQPAALALARTLTEHTSADDVVSEAFEKLLQLIRGGGGPESAFRPYLLRTVRTVAVDASRRTRRLVVAEDPEEAARSLPAEGDELVEGVHERTTLARAFAALPERWQTFLWLSFVDDADRREIATILGINLGSVSALGYRAREGLRRAYLDAHLQERAHARVQPGLAAPRGRCPRRPGTHPAGRRSTSTSTAATTAAPPRPSSRRSTPGSVPCWRRSCWERRLRPTWPRCKAGGSAAFGRRGGCCRRDRRSRFGQAGMVATAAATSGASRCGHRGRVPHGARWSG